MIARLMPVLAAGLLLIAGCGSPTQPSSSTSAGQQKIVVFAAASLKTTFTAIGDQFAKDNPPVPPWSSRSRDPRIW